MVGIGLRLPSRPLPPDVNFASLQFEVVEGGDVLRYGLASAVEACSDGWRFAQSLLGLIPRNSVVNKLPLYRSLVSQPPQACVPRHISWVLATQAAEQEQRQREQEQQQQSIDTVAGGALSATAGTVASLRAPRSQEVQPRRARKRPTYGRDLVTRPGMVLFYNVVLAWMMFNIDVRAAEL